MELLKQLGGLKVALPRLGIIKMTSSVSSKPSKILGVCKFISRLLTVVNQTQKENLRKYKPLQPKKAHTAGSTSMRRVEEQEIAAGETVVPLLKFVVKA
ncbi:hypothetical protein E5288_WYG015488 [Bos mutus]|uniref:60S ribosomal protein L35 n=2 Tax=Bos mutus TaxID=72004 RepID=A0A6B0S6M9_9CETA|nr:PREDICTED: 60S ribosomal protein L35 [Bos mutus]MXQ98369.1 hypothetical protein [Bos mutus]